MLWSLLIVPMKHREDSLKWNYLQKFPEEPPPKAMISPAGKAGIYVIFWYTLQ